MPASRGLRLASLLVAAALISNLFITGARPEMAGLIPAPWDKLAHFVYFFVLAVLLMIANTGRRPWLVGVLLITVGAADEWQQAYVPGREASIADFAADCVGIASGVLAARRFTRPRAVAR